MRKAFLLLVVISITIITIIFYTTYHSAEQYSGKDLSRIISEIDKYINDHKLKANLNLPLYYINMDKNTDRNVFMENQLKKYTTNYKRIRGFNGYSITNPSNDTVDGVHFINAYMNLSKGEIGCTMSHLIAVNNSYNNGDNISLIIEDDTMIHLTHFVDIDKILENAPRDWEIIQLFCVNIVDWKEKDKDKNINFEYHLLNRSRYFNSTVEYIINRKGMEKVLNHAYREPYTFYIGPGKNGIPSNGRADFYIYDLATTYALFPNIFYPNNSDMNSTIHTDHTDSHISRALSVAKHFYNRVIEYFL